MVTCDNCGNEVRGRGLSGRSKCPDCGRMVCPTCRIILSGNSEDPFCSHGNPPSWRLVPLTKELSESIRQDRRKLRFFD